MNELSKEEFALFQHLLLNKAGLFFEPSKLNLLQNRITKRLKKLKINSFAKYYKLVKNSDKEFLELLDLITTKETFFFREEFHFDYLVNEILPKVKNTGQIRIWSAGCATGEEPYSIAIAIDSALQNVKPFIIATDISKSAIEKAKEGKYTEKEIKDVPQKFLKYFRKEDEKFYKILPRIRSQITFQIQNLLHESPPLNFHIIFCRNVMIYFDREIKRKILLKLAQKLVKEGFLFIGSCETIIDPLVKEILKYVKPGIYQKWK